mmetsp:Transcript_28261/g.63934  ORF Transcript_28261/g.63934 Transcript_28261/m.63934 type:complete len:211 (-) Transcript_28261:212-844(-)
MSPPPLLHKGQPGRAGPTAWKASALDSPLAPRRWPSTQCLAGWLAGVAMLLPPQQGPPTQECRLQARHLMLEECMPELGSSRASTAQALLQPESSPACNWKSQSCIEPTLHRPLEGVHPRLRCSLAVPTPAPPRPALQRPASPASVGWGCREALQHLLRTSPQGPSALDILAASPHQGVQQLRPTAPHGVIRRRLGVLLALGVGNGSRGP